MLIDNVAPLDVLVVAPHPDDAELGMGGAILRYRAEGYRVGVPENGRWLEIFNSDAECYAGSNVGNGGGILAEALPSHGQDVSLSLTLPPLGVVILRPQG